MLLKMFKNRTEHICKAITNHGKLKIAFLLLFVLAACTKPQVGDSLPRSTPETEGVSSEEILKFMDAIEKEGIELHSLMVVRHGKVVAEGWCQPYRADLKHVMYSVSKTYTSTAVGFAVSEKLLTVDDKVISFFPEYLPDTISPFLAEMTVKDLLTMSVGQSPEPSFSIEQPNWVKLFLATPIVNEPGTRFLYNSYATYMLSAIVQKVSGQKTFDYLTPRLFEPLHITGIDWEEDIMGINFGGWGLRAKTEDMAKLGQLYLQKGKWNGKQLLPEAWIEEATTAKTDQKPELSQEKRNLDDWAQGYCYQIWRCRHHAFRADGAAGQYIIVMPEQDAVVAITANVNDMQKEINFVWDYLLPAFHTGKLPANETAEKALHDKLASWTLPLPGKTSSPESARISGKTYTINANDVQLEKVTVGFENDQCKLTLQSGAETYSFSFGCGQWIDGQTEKYLMSRRRNSTAKAPFQVSGYYQWTDNNTLVLNLRYTEYTMSEIYTLHFDGDKVTVNVKSSTGANGMTLEGHI